MDHLSTELLGRTRVPEGEQAESRGLLAASWTPLGAGQESQEGPTSRKQHSCLDTAPGAGVHCQEDT